MDDLLDVGSHFAFGENWKSYLNVLDEQRIVEAELGMKRLFPNGELSGARFLDIGCGSGLSSLSAERLGAAWIQAVDIDSNSVEATAGLLTKMSSPERWNAKVKSVFDLSPDRDGTFDVVYSWGVLHHTGDMWRAIKCAASMVKPGGRFAIALYRKTPYCGLWTFEKKLYAKAPKFVQAAIRGPYKAAYCANLLRQGVNPATHIRNYKTSRGMNWSHDVHDWLGGYPYQSASAEEVRTFLAGLGFRLERQFVQAPSTGYLSFLSGLFGSGCDEFVAVRASE